MDVNRDVWIMKKKHNNNKNKMISIKVSIYLFFSKSFIQNLKKKINNDSTNDENHENRFILFSTIIPT